MLSVFDQVCSGTAGSNSVRHRTGGGGGGVRHGAPHCGIKVAARPHLVLTENWASFIKVWAKFFWIGKQEEEQKEKKKERKRNVVRDEQK